MQQPTVYILTNKRDSTLYTDVTSNLINRIWQHKNSSIKIFTHKYKISMPVYYEQLENIQAAIEREKQIKAGSRKKKLELIENFNPNWTYLYNKIIN